MIIGIDDTDSVSGMCTTYLTAVLMEKNSEFGRIKDLPYLIRLNPNIKYKTRGNAALAIPVEVNDPVSIKRIKEIAISLVEEMAVFSDENTNPGVVFIENDESPEPAMSADLQTFAIRAVREVIEISEADAIIRKYGIDHRGYKNRRGLIGALAAAGFALCGLDDRTYELIAYRERKRWGTPRHIDACSVMRADSCTYPRTWDTVDIENGRIVFAPHSPDPVLFGIRGADVEVIRKSFDMIESEPIERYAVYQTNQNTDMHLMPGRIADVRNDQSYILTGTVIAPPLTSEGGHVFFKIAENGNTIQCAAFEPTKNFRNIVRQLHAGDKVTVYGSVKDSTVNLEKIELVSLVEFEYKNPVCVCGKSMESAGRGQGYRCKKCGTSNKAARKVHIARPEPGLYEVPPCARRHLAKPLIRFNKRVINIHPSR